MMPPPRETDPPSPTDAGDADLEKAAEQVRAYLVAVRGGAPFLSGSDGRLLIRWLESGVPAPLLTALIDQVAEQRRAKRARSRMTLRSVQAALKKHLDLASEAPTPAPPPKARAQRDGLDRLRATFTALDLPTALEPHRAQLLAACALRDNDVPIDEIARTLVHACARFHQALWEQADTAALREAARREIGALEKAVSPKVFVDLVDELARSRLRERYPAVSAKAVWDTLSLLST